MDWYQRKPQEDTVITLVSFALLCVCVLGGLLWFLLQGLSSCLWFSPAGSLARRAWAASTMFEDCCHCMLCECLSCMKCFECNLCRSKTGPSLVQSDREIFESLPLGDPWHDAQMLEVWNYLWNHPKLEIPCSWLESMKTFDRELRATIGCWCHVVLLETLQE